MSVETWEQIPKNQTNSELIEEAIARLIAVHEADPEAHTGENESLQAHRQNEIVDHPAGSILIDKNTMTEFYIDDDFRTITQWYTVGSVSNDDWPSLKLYVEYGAINTSKIEKEIEIPSPFLTKNYDMLFQVLARYNMSSSAFKSWLGIGLYSALPSGGFGFIWENGVLKCIVARGSTRVYSDTISIAYNQDHIYRAQLNSELGLIYFYIDGSLVATLSVPAISWDDDSGPTMGITLTTENDGNLWLANLSFSRSII